jgi:uncharacterized protein DUF4386
MTHRAVETPVDDSQRAAARVAGFAYLFTFATVVYVNFGIHDRLIVAGNAAETARNILAHERLFRIGIAGDLIYCAGVVVLLTALYVKAVLISRSAPVLSRPGRFLVSHVDVHSRSDCLRFCRIWSLEPQTHTSQRPAPTPLLNSIARPGQLNQMLNVI